MVGGGGVIQSKGQKSGKSRPPFPLLVLSSYLIKIR